MTEKPQNAWQRWLRKKETTNGQIVTVMLLLFLFGLALGKYIWG